MEILLILAIVAYVAANAVRFRRRGRGALLLAGLVATLLAAGVFVLPDALAPRAASPGWPHKDAPPRLGNLFFVLAALCAGAGFLTLGAVASRRARREAGADRAHMIADAAIGSLAWVVGALAGGIVIGVIGLILLAGMAP